MLKTTYKPSAALAPLLPGWTEHKAPSGHSYYYHADTKVSTYQRPCAEPNPQTAPEQRHAYSSAPNLADPNVANAFMAQLNAPPPGQHQQRGGHAGRGGRGEFEGRPRPQPMDKPRKKEAIPGHEPWILVYTKYSRRFVYNPIKNTSYWRIPEKLMPAILDMDKKRISGKGDEEKTAKMDEKVDGEKDDAGKAAADHDYNSSEYEEVEVTDDEGLGEGDEAGDEHPSKRQRIAAEPNEGGDNAEGEEEEEVGPIEFTEADIAMQLQAMGEDYGLEPGDYDDGNMDDWPEGTEGMDFSEEDAKFLFKDLLNDFGINPYSPWDKLLEEGKVVDDPRYTALSTTKARKECWDEWSREKIAELKEQRSKQEKKDPRVPYMQFLHEKATPKLYWPEFKRKYKKEAPMKDLNLSDKDREKAYRDHINRLKLPQTTLKSDLTALLKSQPVHALNNQSLVNGMPVQVLIDGRYISLEPKVRDPLVEAYVQTLPPPPQDLAAAAKDDEGRRKERDARERRERALEERNRMVEEQRRRRERDVAMGKFRLREEERELEAAMRVGKKGLQSQLADLRVDQEKDAP